MSHKDVNPHILFPFLISCGAAFIISVAFSHAPQRGHNPQSACINECYEQLLERREVTRLAKLEEERLIATGVIEAPVVEIDPTPASWNGCAGCHGMKGEGMGIFPALAGNTSSYIETALMQYQNREKRGKRSQIMWSQASILSKNDIKVLSNYIEGL
jgi:hypothetical protein|tara:strand:- start:46 stop:519 length:474 start_codon:yes stop_codon:yes gene_type:complete